nr:DUF6402 family protein [Paraburkholderia lycopersici]
MSCRCSTSARAPPLLALKKWLSTPDPPKPPKTPTPAKPEKTAPSFDIQEIPGAMRKKMMPIGARLTDRRFAGRVNYSPTGDAEKAEINQDGKPYPPDMYDMNIVKLDWVLKFARAEAKYNYLITEAVRSPNVILKGKLRPYRCASDVFHHGNLRKRPR